MPIPVSRRRVILIAAGAFVLIGFLYVGARLYRLGERPLGLPDPTPKFDAANILPELNCGNLDGAKLTGDGSVFLWGWAYDPRSGTPARAVILLDKGRQIAPPIQVFRERPDVVAAKGNPRLLTSGWNFRLPDGSRMDREHVFETYAVFEDGKLGRVGEKLRVGEAMRPGEDPP